jgi:hypothetical protein
MGREGQLLALPPGTPCKGRRSNDDWSPREEQYVKRAAKELQAHDDYQNLKMLSKIGKFSYISV